MFEIQFICFALVLAILAIVKTLMLPKIKFTSFDRFTEIFGKHGKKTVRPCHLQFIHEYGVSIKL
jgi:hypothetical protein